MSGEDAVTNEHVKSGWPSFLLEISRWTMIRLHRPVEFDNNQIETLNENNQRYTMWEIDNILKIKSSTEITCIILVMLISLIFWFHISGKKKTYFAFCMWYSLLKRNKNVPFLKQIVMGNEKCKLNNNVQWKRWWGQAKWTTTNHTKG